ncbi:MAG: hypothetical protein QOG64_1020 [Acidimicrobiaceae bacterium]|nr:hypothetical protein [Acidimicrobiaceae bacterium]
MLKSGAARVQAVIMGVALLISGIGVTAVASATTATGTITGTVTNNAATPAPLAGICVNTGAGGSPVTTSSTGAYTLTAPVGSHHVRFFDCASGGYLLQWYNGTAAGAPVQTSATPVNTGATGINARMVGAGSITGTTFDSGSNPVGNICVAVSDGKTVNLQGRSNGFSPIGAYTVGGLPAGRYSVTFTDCNNLGFMTQYYNKVANPVALTLVTVPAAGTVSAIDAHLLRGATITGTTFDNAATPRALGNICVNATDGLGHSYDARSAASGTTGFYSIAGVVPNKYQVHFSDCGAGLDGAQYYNRAATAVGASVVATTAGAPASAINAYLLAAGRISGTVTDNAATPTGLGNVCVSVNDGNGHNAGAVTSTIAPVGSYTITGLTAGKYEVHFTDCGPSPSHVAQYYSGAASPAAATPVNVTSGATTANINAKLVASGAISGTVTDNSPTPQPLANVCVTATNGQGPVGGGQTSPAGTYTIVGLAPGRYNVDFSDCGTGTLLRQYYSNATSSAAARYVTVAAGGTTTAINAKMLPGRSISGTVFNAAPTPAPITGICVSADDGNGHRGSAQVFNPSGAYSITDLAPGKYQVSFSPCFGPSNGYVPQYYLNSDTALGATVVNLTTANATGINAHMVATGSISGTVRDTAPTPAPVAGACVQAIGPGFFSAMTDGSGHYTLSGVRPGTYDVSFSACGPGGSQWWNGVPTQDGATPVTVTAGGAMPGIDGQISTAPPAAS